QEQRESVVVGAGKRVVIENNLVESVIDETTDDLDRHLYWRKGYLAFKDQSLNQVVAEVSRYATFNIVISEPSIGDMRVGGYYPIDNLETVFSSFEINLGLVVEKHNDNTYYIKSDKSENQEKS
ncbi:MAG: FecR domain-containing protein, partial [Paraglaciecola sp.]|uniref:FecR domain-containing protein n=1 Tax=Paraglaciecola sp. TaxID=1920173 RepID=UPI003299EDCC